MDTSTPTFIEATQDARRWAREAFAYSGADGDCSDAAADVIDWCSYVIYDDEALALWCSSDDVRAREPEAIELIQPEGTIRERIALCVQLALRDAFEAEWEACRAEATS